MTLKLIPAAGILGLVALREAASGEYNQVINLVRAALQERYKDPKISGYQHVWVEIEAIYADRVIVCKDGRYWQFKYILDDKNVVQLQEPVEVIERFDPVAMREAAIESGVTFIEAKDEGKVWEVIVIGAGLSANGNFYPDAVLREAVRSKVFEGARVYVKSNDEHVKGGRPDIKKLGGWLSGIRFVEGKAADTGRIEGQFNFSGFAELRETLVDAWKRGKRDLVGLSIDAVGMWNKRAKPRAGMKRMAESILKVNSVDLILDPAAGGALVRLVEAVNSEEQDPMKERMIEAIKAKFPQLDVTALSDEQLLARYAEAIAAAPAGNFVTVEQLQERDRMAEARASAAAKINATTLPAPSKARLIERFGKLERFVEADVANEIQAERDHVVRLAESLGVDAGTVRLSESADIVVEDRPKKIQHMLDAFFNPGGKDEEGKLYPRVASFKECYIEITGDRRVTGRLEHCDRRRMAESIGRAFESLDTSAFSDVLGSTLRRTLVADYNRPNHYDVWRKLAVVVPVADFRTNERTRYGGYGDLPAVLEGENYNALTSPTDEKATYAVSKKGGTEDVTLEMIKNDDVGAIRQIPMKLSRAAKRTVAKLVLDLIRTNPAIYDSVAFFHNDHGNLGANALDATYLAAARLRMLKQTEADSLDRLGIGPRYLAVPVDLEETAQNLFSRNTNNDKTFVNNMSLEVLPVWYWTDSNDWSIHADPQELPAIEVGFLDGNEEPELFVQDAPSVGSMFTHDKLTYKIRQIAGATVTNYRGADKSVVT